MYATILAALIRRLIVNQKLNNKSPVIRAGSITTVTGSVFVFIKVIPTPNDQKWAFENVFLRLVEFSAKRCVLGVRRELFGSQGRNSLQSVF